MPAPFLVNARQTQVMMLFSFTYTSLPPESERNLNVTGKKRHQADESRLADFRFVSAACHMMVLETGGKPHDLET